MSFVLIMRLRIKRRSGCIDVGHYGSAMYRRTGDQLDRLYGHFRFGNHIPSRFSACIPHRLPPCPLRKHTDVESHA